jgi:glycosyltransferase involved in cell wall biosynthesis
MACGIPVVASRVGGLADTIIDGVTGIHVDPRDPSGLAGAIRRLLDRPAARAAMGHSGRDRAERLYRWQGVAAATDGAYQAALRANSLVDRLVVR